MIRRMLLATITVLAGTALVASAAPKEEVADAAKKLAEAKSYSWKTTTQNQGGGGGGGGGRGMMGPTEGKIEKDGFTHLTMTRGENTTEAVVKGNKGAIKTQEGWKSLAEASEGEPGPGNPGRFLAPTLQNFKAPAMQAQELAEKVKDLKKDGDAYTGELTEEGAKQLMTFGGRGGGNAPDISGAKGTAKFWAKDGALSKFEYNVQGTISFNGNERQINRTTTTEIKEVGSTKVEVPEEAKKKLEA